MVGTMEADETYVGGKVSKRVAVNRTRKRSDEVRQQVPVVALVNRDTARFAPTVMPRVTRENLHAVHRQDVNMKHSRALHR